MHTKTHTSFFHRTALCAVMVLAWIGAAPASPAAAPQPQPQSFIVGASTTEEAARQVTAVGGRVTHELGIIRSVAARLSAEQAGALAARGLRIHADAATSVAGKGGAKGGGGGPSGDPAPEEPPATCQADHGGLLEFQDIQVELELLNTGGTDLTIDQVAVVWTPESGYLQKIKLKRTVLFKGERFGTQTTVDSGWEVGPSSRRIPAGRSSTLKLVFPQGVDPRQSAFEIDVVFAEGCAVSYRPGARGASSIPDGYVPDTFHPRAVGADRLWAEGVTGYGVTVAVLDAAVKESLPGIKADRNDVERVYARYNAVLGQLCDGVLENCTSDSFGHGTHVAGIVVGSTVTDWGHHAGIAPDAGLVVVEALDANGVGTYADVIRGIDWIVANRDLYGIRVLNLSLSAAPQSYYWDDPLAQAVMAAWQAGLVVVASAGNNGPEPQTIGVPGNVPYIVTVGAVSDGYTSLRPGDDYLTSFSAAGPTFEGFVKPELVAPGGHVISNMQDSMALAVDHPEHRFGDQYFQMSGTSQSTAVVSGIVALMLEADPSLTPDDVKCRLMDSARPAVDEAGGLAYSVFQQGAGAVDAYAAAHSQATGCANRGLDVGLDLTGVQHYGGRANLAEDGTYYLMGLDGDGFTWSDGFMWSDGFTWSDGFMWSDGFTWSDGLTWADGVVWSNAGSASIATNSWVEQE